MASVEHPRSTPASPYHLTSAKHSAASASASGDVLTSASPFSPRCIPLPTSPGPNPRETYHDVSQDLSSRRRCLSPTSPTSPQSPPPRPPRPPTSLPNIRPTVILSPSLVPSLPPADRPFLLKGKTSFSTTSTSTGQPTFSTDTTNSSIIEHNPGFSPPSPCFFTSSTHSADTQLLLTTAPTSTLPKAHFSSARRPSLPNPSRSPRSPRRKRGHHSHSTSTSSASASNSSLIHIHPLPPSPSPYPPPTSPLPAPPPLPPSFPIRRESLLPHLPQPPTQSPLVLEPPPHHQISTIPEDSTAQSHFPDLSFSTSSPTASFTQTQVESPLALPPCPPSPASPKTTDSVPRVHASRHQRWHDRHRQRLYILGTIIVVMALAAGVVAGVIWKLSQ